MPVTIPPPREGRADITSPPPPIRTSTITLIGTALFAIAFVATMLVDSWHTGPNRWYPWAAGTGVVLGLIGYVYLRAGVGNAAMAEENLHPETYEHD